MAFTATANGSTVNLGPVPRRPRSTGTTYKLTNAATGLVHGVQNMSTADGGLAVMWGDTGTADHRWTLVDSGDGTYKIRNVHSGKLLGVLDGSTAWGAQAVQDSDNGSAGNRWRLIPSS